MYDGRTNPGRNDECWCGSGKKYKKCHLAFDERLQSMYEQGFELPERASLKSAADIEGIKRSAAINIGVLDYVAERIGPGTTTEEVDRWVHDYTVEHGGIPADLGYEGYPKSVCTSINDVVCHGIPSEDDVLREGDIVNVDCSTILDGYYSDSSRMFCIGAVSPERQRLVDETKKAMEAGLAAIEPWGLLGDVGAAVNAYAKAQGFSVVREFGGHGIGFDFHEDPFVSHVSEPGTGMVLVPGPRVHHRAHGERRRGAHRHERSERLDRAHRRRQRHRPVGSAGRHHRGRLRVAELVGYSVSRKALRNASSPEKHGIAGENVFFGR